MNGAAPSDVVHLEGTFTGSGNRDVLVPMPLTFSGPATIDCEGSAADNHRAFSLEASCTFLSLTIRNGCMTADRRADRGGAIYAADLVAAKIHDCTFEDNTAVSGGALAFDSLDLAGASGSDEVHVTDSTFLRNHAEGSGVVYLLGISIYFERCRLIENVARSGGVADFFHAETHFTDCLLEGNRATTRGGAIATNTWATFTRCSLVRNAAAQGAHLWVGGFDAYAAVTNSILAFGEGGGAMYCTSIDESSDIFISCSDVFANVGGDFNRCVEDEIAAHGNFSSDPLFCDPMAGNYTLQADSPCAAEAGGSCGLIGALPIACRPTAVQSVTWGSIKARYR